MRLVGLDVHAATIAAAVAEAEGEVRELGIIANRPEAVRVLLTKLGEPSARRGASCGPPCRGCSTSIARA
jgi:hypothetical protein